MSSRKHTGKYARKSKRRLPLLVPFLIALALVSLSIGDVVAYLSRTSGDVTNTFLADADPIPEISESFDGTTKSNVAVDVGQPGYAVYVRAAVVVTWRDEAGNVLAEAPEVSTDYSITYNTADWFEHGGFWYCRTMVNSGNSPVLIETCQPLVSNGKYHLHVEIISQTIQALGTTDAGDTPAVTDAWGIQVSTAGSTKGQLTP